ncbi:hypothetical protein D3C84_944930 [compost metagenome]
MLRDLAHLGEVLCLLADLRRAQADRAAIVAGEDTLGGLQMTLLLRGLITEVLLNQHANQAQHHAHGQQAPAQRARAAARLKVEHQGAHVRPPPGT